MDIVALDLAVFSLVALVVVLVLASRKWGASKLATHVILPPFRLKLLPIDKPDWLKKPTIMLRLDALKACGFQIVGIYRVEGARDTYTIGLVQPETHVSAAIHWVKEQACLDLVCRYKDGSSAAYCDHGNGSKLGHSPQHTAVWDALAYPKALYERLLAERRQDIVPVTAEDFVPRFEKAYNEAMDWQAERGGYPLDEIRAEALRYVYDASPQAIEDIHQAFAGHALKNWLSMQPDRPEPWEEKEITVVHDDLTMRQLAGLFALVQDDENAVSESAIAAAGSAASEAFAVTNGRLGDRFIKVGEKKTARAADFYISMPVAEQKAKAA